MRTVHYCGLGITLFLLIFSNVGAANLFVSSTGSDTACTQVRPCLLHTALSKAVDDDTVYVAQGIYTGTGDTVITITKNIALLGGWNGEATQRPVRDPPTHVTLLSGEDQRQVLSITGDITPVIDGFRISGGKAPDGGGMFVNNASPVIRNNVITGNRTVTGSYTNGRGGGIFVGGTSRASILNNRISQNQSGYGAGIYHSGSNSISIIGNEISANAALSRAGGILEESTSDQIRDNLISLNTAVDDGGGILTWDSAAMIQNNRFVENSAVQGAGVSMGNGASPTLQNNVFINNEKDAISVEGSSPLISNNTIMGKNESTSGYGVFLRSFAGCVPPYCTQGRIENNIVMNYNFGIYSADPVTTIIDYNDAWGCVTSNYSLPSALEVGAHNISMDPLFVDGPSGDYHLRNGSPCVNAGDPAGVPPAPAEDADGESRDSRPDIGAYEYSPVRPRAGTVGTEITIRGSGLGTKKGKIFLDTFSLKVLNWTDEEIQCTIARPVEPGSYDITVAPPKTASSVIPNAFSIGGPQVESIEPPSGSAGDEIRINGLFFGKKKGKVLIEEKTSKVKSWTMDPLTGEGVIRAVVPKGLESGVHELRVTNGVASTSVDFTVE
jgi:parallel beta-helix repeat protein